MAALAANSTADLRHKGDIRPYRMTNGVATETYYLGAVLSFLAAGKITPVSASGLKYAGLCVEPSDGAIGTSDKVLVATGGQWLLPIASAAVTDEGELAYIDVAAGSDNPADLVMTSTSNEAVGRVRMFVSSTLGSWTDTTDRALSD